jgi:hypothetical protein
VEVTQSLDAYRTAHLQTSAELRAESATLQERVAILERVQIEDKGIRERTMEQMELSLQELMNVTALERDARLEGSKQEEMNMSQSLEVVGQAQEDIRKEIDAVAENCGTVRDFVDRYVQDLTRMVQEESEARLQFSEIFDAHRSEACDRIERLEINLQEPFAKGLGVRTELKVQVDLAMEKISNLEAAAEEIDARHGRSSELLERSLLELRQVIMQGERADSVALREGLETVSSTLTKLAGDLEVERLSRVREASSLQSEVQAIKCQLLQVEAVTASRENTVDELRSITRPGLESISKGLHTVTAHMEEQKAASVRESTVLQSGIEAMQRRITNIEASASEDKGWRQQAVQDLEGILGDLRHITPAATASRSLPTLATALRLSKADA